MRGEVQGPWIDRQTTGQLHNYIGICHVLNRAVAEHVRLPTTSFHSTIAVCGKLGW